MDIGLMANESTTRNGSTSGKVMSFTDITILKTIGVCVTAKAYQDGIPYMLRALDKPYRSNPQYQHYLRREYLSFCMAHHPCIFEVYDLIQTGELGLCIVMEWSEGPTMTEWLKTNPPLEDRKYAAEQVMSALAFAHRMHLVHRNLTGDYIIMSRENMGLKIYNFRLPGETDSQGEGLLSTIAEGRDETEELELWDQETQNDIYMLGVLIEQLNLGRRYNNFIKRCKKRGVFGFQGMAPVIKAFNNVRVAPIKIICISLIVALAIAGGSIALRFVQLHQNDDVVTTNVVDLSDQMSVEEHARAERLTAGDSLVTDAGPLVQEGCKSIDKFVTNLNFESKLTSATSRKMANELYSYCVDQTSTHLKEYIDGLPPTIDAKTRASISSHLTDYARSYISQWSELIQNAQFK